MVVRRIGLPRVPTGTIESDLLVSPEARPPRPGARSASRRAPFSRTASIRSRSVGARGVSSSPSAPPGPSSHANGTAGASGPGGAWVRRGSHSSATGPVVGGAGRSRVRSGPRARSVRALIGRADTSRGATALRRAPSAAEVAAGGTRARRTTTAESRTSTGKGAPPVTGASAGSISGTILGSGLRPSVSRRTPRSATSARPTRGASGRRRRACRKSRGAGGWCFRRHGASARGPR